MNTVKNHKVERTLFQANIDSETNTNPIIRYPSSHKTHIASKRIPSPGDTKHRHPPVVSDGQHISSSSNDPSPSGKRSNTPAKSNSITPASRASPLDPSSINSRSSSTSPSKRNTSPTSRNSSEKPRKPEELFFLGVLMSSNMTVVNSRGTCPVSLESLQSSIRKTIVNNPHGAVKYVQIGTHMVYFCYSKSKNRNKIYCAVVTRRYPAATCSSMLNDLGVFMAINADNKNFNVPECLEVVFDKYVAAVIDSSSVLEGAEFEEEQIDPNNVSPTRVRFYKGPNGKGPLQTSYNRGTSFHLDDFDEVGGPTENYGNSLLNEHIVDWLNEHGYRLIAVVTCFTLLVLLLDTTLRLRVGISLLISICILLMILSVTYLLRGDRTTVSTSWPSLYLSSSSSSMMPAGDDKHAYSTIA